MEKNLKKKSINTMIYLLLAAMLVCMVFVSVYTVASKRERGAKTDEQRIESNSSSGENRTDKPSERVDTEKKLDSETITDEKKGVNSIDSDAAQVDALPANEADEEPSSAAEHYFVLPVSGFVSKSFEVEVPVWSATMNDYRAHTGADIAAAVGSEVIAASSGRVCKIWNDPMMGRSVTIDHGDDIYTSYMNLGDNLTVTVGEKVGMGQVLGCVGSSSLAEVAEEPHLHLEMKLGGEYVDPLEYMSEGEYPLADE